MTTTTEDKKKNAAKKAETAPAKKPGGKTLAGLFSLVNQATKGALKPVSYKVGQLEHIPTKIVQIDTLIGGELTRDKKLMKCPGLPKGRILEVYGAESSGKTTLALQFAVAVQKAGGRVLYLDFERALDQSYAEAIGIDFHSDTFGVLEPETFEDGVKAIILACREQIDLIVTDSVAAMIPASELIKKVDDPQKVGILASTMSKYLPRLNMRLDQSGTTLLLINQTRALISTGGHSAETENTSGGKALKFYCYLRLKTTRIKSEMVEKLDPTTMKKRKFPYGNVTQIKMVKNKVSGTQGYTTEVFIRYGSGVDEYLSLIESAVPRKIIVKAGSNYTFSGQTFKGKERLRKFLVENPKLTEELRAKIMQAIVDDKVMKGIAETEEIEDEDIVSDNREDADLGEDDGEDVIEALEQTLDESEVEGS